MAARSLRLDNETGQLQKEGHCVLVFLAGLPGKPLAEQEASFWTSNGRPTLLHHPIDWAATVHKAVPHNRFCSNNRIPNPK